MNTWIPICITNYLSEYLLYILSISFIYIIHISLSIYLKLPLTHTFSPCIYICISTRALSLSLAVLMLYSCFTHALLMLYSCFSADGAQVNRSLLCAHHLDRRPQNRHALLLFTPALLRLYSRFTHALLMLYPALLMLYYSSSFLRSSSWSSAPRWARFTQLYSALLLLYSLMLYSFFTQLYSCFTGALLCKTHALQMQVCRPS